MNMNDFLASEAVRKILERSGVGENELLAAIECRMSFEKKLGTVKPGLKKGWMIMNQRKNYADILAPLGVTASDASRYSDMNTSAGYSSGPPKRESEYLHIVYMGCAVRRNA